MYFRLEQFVLSRFEAENGGELLVATLSLLEVSARGLLEAELKVILGDEENLMPPKDNGDEKGYLFLLIYNDLLCMYVCVHVCVCVCVRMLCPLTDVLHIIMFVKCLRAISLQIIYGAV